MTTPAPIHTAHAPSRQDKLTGVACGIGAGALWGLVFLAPELADAFNPLQLTVGRYLSYGLIAAALIAPRWRSLLRQVSRQQWLHLTGLAFAGNTLYYIFLASAVQRGGIATTSLIIGFLPVVITIIGSRDRGAVPLAKLLPSLLLGAGGVICISWQALATPTGSIGERTIGLLCAVGGLVSWTAYAVGNARCLARLERVSVRDWGLLLGVATGAQSVVLIPFALVLGSTDQSSDEWIRLGVVSVGLAVVASIIGTALWNKMSHLLPLTLVGQMILFETLFALLYGFLWETRLPTLLEMVALVAVVLSVLSCLAAHRRPEQQAPDPAR